MTTIDDDTDFTAHERVHLSMLLTKLGGAHPNAHSPRLAKCEQAQGVLEVERVGRDIVVRATGRHYATASGQQTRQDIERILDPATAVAGSPGGAFLPAGH